MSPRRRLPAGIRGRGAVFTYAWRDAAGRQYSDKAGGTLQQAEAFKRRIDDQLAWATTGRSPPRRSPPTPSPGSRCGR